MLAWFDLELEQLDVKTTFFMASLKSRSLYISQRDSLLKAKKTTCAG